MDKSQIPDIVVGRLPLYLRSLNYMLNQNIQVTSSQELGQHLGISAAQIRKDLSLFGEFGKQGTGYNVSFLAKQLTQILNVEQVWEVALVGAGDIGHAIARYQGFANRGFRIAMIFDNDPAKIGSQVGEFIVRDIANLKEDVHTAGIQIAMLAVPDKAAQQVAELLVQAGVRAILNYAPITLNVPQNVQVQYIDPAVHLQRMTYYL